MSFCTNCGKEIIENSKFCTNCGTAVPVQETAPVVAEAPVVEVPVAVEAPVAVETPVDVVAPVVAAPVQVAPAPTFADKVTEDSLIKEEQEFLDMTHRFLRWERKANSISGKIMFICGIVFTAIFGLISFISMIEAMDYSYSYDINLFSVSFTYTSLFAFWIVAGTIQKKIAEKMPTYLDSLYTDFTVTQNRSGNVKMLVLSIIFCNVGLVFFLINFIRIKSSENIINRILARQGKN